MPDQDRRAPPGDRGARGRPVGHLRAAPLLRALTSDGAHTGDQGRGSGGAPDRAPDGPLPRCLRSRGRDRNGPVDHLHKERE